MTTRTLHPTDYTASRGIGRLAPSADVPLAICAELPNADEIAAARAALAEHNELSANLYRNFQAASATLVANRGAIEADRLAADEAEAIKAAYRDADTALEAADAQAKRLVHRLHRVVWAELGDVRVIAARAALAADERAKGLSEELIDCLQEREKLLRYAAAPIASAPEPVYVDRNTKLPSPVTRHWSFTANGQSFSWLSEVAADLRAIVKGIPREHLEATVNADTSQ